MPVLEVPVFRAIEKGLLDEGKIQETSYEQCDITSLARDWFKKYCGPVGGLNIKDVQWFSKNFDWSNRVVFRASTGDYYVRVVIPDARAAMLFKLTWM